MTGFAYQLYSSRNFPPLKDTLTMLGGLGYTSVEGYGALYANPQMVDELKGSLADSGLTMPTGHFGLQQLEADPSGVNGIARALGVTHIYCPYVMPDDRPGDQAGWVAFGQRLANAGKPFRDAGFGFGWHNHDFEFRALADGSYPIEAILEGAPDLELEADIAWIIRGGGDPIAWVDRLADRITAIHVKDIAPAGQNAAEDGWADVGKGTVNWKAIFAAVRSQTKAGHFVIEHDNPSDHRRFAERSLAAAKTY
jgi:sugar phosphate isomerase/epimerase